MTGTGPLGCVPAELAQRSRNGECSPELQRAAGLFNPQLTQMLLSINSEIGSDVFIAANTQVTHYDFISNPQQFGTALSLSLIHTHTHITRAVKTGLLPLNRHDQHDLALIDSFFFSGSGAGFVTSKVACCGQGPYNGIGLCTPLSNLCPNRDVYAFWDPFHPSERANRIIVQQILTGSLDYMNPMNLSTILAMDSQT